MCVYIMENKLLLGIVLALKTFNSDPKHFNRVFSPRMPRACQPKFFLSVNVIFLRVMCNFYRFQCVCFLFFLSHVSHIAITKRYSREEHSTFWSDLELKRMLHQPHQRWLHLSGNVDIVIFHLSHTIWVCTVVSAQSTKQVFFSA